MQNASHLLQNILTLHSKYHKHISKANTFAIILIPVKLLLHRELCVLFSKKCFMKLKTESKAENYCMILQIWCVLLLFECQVSEIVTSKDFVYMQLKNKIV